MRVFYDVDTQNDFMNRDGALYVPDAELIKPNLRELTKYALQHQIQILGSLDRHFGTPEYKTGEGELAKWGGPFPDHCMNLTNGQMKIEETNPIENKTRIKCEIPSDGPLINRREMARFLDHTQIFNGIYFEKQSYDVFTNPALELFLEMARIKEAIVYGVATDFCVRAAVLGMQRRGVQCYVVEDAIKGVFPDKSKQALEEMVNTGAKLTTTKDVLKNEQFTLKNK